MVLIELRIIRHRNDHYGGHIRCVISNIINKNIINRSDIRIVYEINLGMVEFTKTRPVFSMKFQVSKVIPYVFNGFYILFEYISTGRNRFYCIYVTLAYVFLLVKSC